MERQVLFIQGGGDGGFEADSKLVASLQTALGDVYKVYYPRMPADEALPDFGWLQQISHEITRVNGEVVLAGHSLGASMLLKCLSEHQPGRKVAGIFLLATPFWSGEASWVQGLKLQADFADKLPAKVPVFLYHCRDDEEVPFEHLALYRQKLPHAAIREIESGGHHFRNDLTMVANDIRLLFKAKPARY